MIGLTYENASLSLDRLTICFNTTIEKVEASQSVLIGWKNENIFPNVEIKSTYRYQTSFRWKLIDPTTQLTAAVCLETGPKWPDLPAYRLDYNPSTLTAHTSTQLWSFLETVVDNSLEEFLLMGRVTRMDVALDFHKLSLADVVVCSKRAKKVGVYSDQKGNPETVYLGGPRSRRIVAYQKEGTQGDFLRLEIRLRPKKLGKHLVSIPFPFKGVELLKNDAIPALPPGVPFWMVSDSIRVRGLSRVMKLLNKKQTKQLKMSLKSSENLLQSSEKMIAEHWPIILQYFIFDGANLHPAKTGVLQACKSSKKAA